MIQPRMPTLRRALGRWDLTALGVNQVIGGAIFVWPAQVAAQIGGWSPVGFVAIGILSLSVALCFAEVGSRFEGTGGVAPSSQAFANNSQPSGHSAVAGDAPPKPRSQMLKMPCAFQSRGSRRHIHQ